MRFTLGWISAILMFTAAATAQTVTVDNVDSGFSVTDGVLWQTGTSASGRFGADYRFAFTGANATTTATWTPVIPISGYYYVYTQFPQGGNRSNNAPFTITGDLGSSTVRINQQVNGGSFFYLAQMHFAVGSSGKVELGINANPTVVLADAVRFVYVGVNPGPDPPGSEPTPPEVVTSETRALWVSRFEWPNASEATAKANIDNIMATAAANNFNTILFQVRGQMDTHYPSPYEPWTNTYSWTNPGWDPLAYAIEKAHQHGLEFHAYINTHTMTSPIPPANTTPVHQYHLHGPTVPIEQSWLIRDQNGDTLTSDNYHWISPGIPEASWWTRRAILHVVQNYDIDGLHFDRIRTPGSQFSYDPISVARLNGDGNPDNLAFSDFMRSQITRDLRNIYGETMKYKPHVKLSAAPFGIVYKDGTTQYQGTGTQSYHVWHQDSWTWMQSHVLDFMVPQIYWEVASAHPFEKLLADWLANSGDRPCRRRKHHERRQQECKRPYRRADTDPCPGCRWPCDLLVEHRAALPRAA